MTSLSPAEAHALARIDGLRPALLAEIAAWAAINTGSRNLAGLAQMIDVLEAAFGPLGGTATRVGAARNQTSSMPSCTRKDATASTKVASRPPRV